jgi:hypothetical protein
MKTIEEPFFTDEELEQEEKAANQSTVDSIVLSPCAFCGAEATFDMCGKTYFIACKGDKSNCLPHMNTGCYTSKKAAANAWNKRGQNG